MQLWWVKTQGDPDSKHQDHDQWVIHHGSAKSITQACEDNTKRSKHITLSVYIDATNRR